MYEHFVKRTSVLGNVNSESCISREEVREEESSSISVLSHHKRYRDDTVESCPYL